MSGHGLDWWSARVPSAEEVVLGPLLRRRAEEAGEEVFALFEGDGEWTWSEAWREARAAAARLRQLGVGRGDRVLSWLPNGRDALRVWFGANLLGAYYVPLNTAYRGRLLEHAVTLVDAEVILVHPELRDRLAEIEAPALRQVVEVGPQTWSGVEPIDPDPEVAPWDPYAIIFTSGTTGPSKGVVCSYVHVAATAAAVFAELFGRGDRYMVNLPLFHAGGTIGVYAALLTGGSVAIVDRFDTKQFWDAVRATGTTHVTLLGAMATFLAKQPPSERDRDHPLKHVFSVPLVDGSPEFAARFGVSLTALFNMTEVSLPMVSEPDPATPGACGRVRKGAEVRLVDEHDREVPVGEVGELIVRTDRPWAMNSGYWGMPEATAEAWRNGWFHTGDAFRRDDAGEFFFVDRIKDAIRRRGENISSFDVEAEVLAHPAVQEAAAVAVPSPHGEDDVMVVISPVEGSSVDPAELVEFLAERMAHFMVPRYVRVLPELPKTATSKVEKHRLRAEGPTDETWDREAEGIRIKAARLGGG